MPEAARLYCADKKMKSSLNKKEPPRGMIPQNRLTLLPRIYSLSLEIAGRHGDVGRLVVE